MYRDNAMPAPVVLREIRVITRRGQALVIFLGVVAILLLCAGGVSVFAGAPPGIEAWKWPMVGGGVAVLVAALAAHRTRRRTLTLTQIGDRRIVAIVDENVELELPARCSGAQFTTSTNGIPLYTVWLKAIDAKGRAVLFQETRGAIYGRLDDWYAVTERTDQVPTFETSKVDMIIELRDLLLGTKAP